MTQLRVIYTSHTETAREPDTKDKWDRGDTRTEHSVESLVIGEDHHNLTIDGDVNLGDELWVVYAIWSTGDSFGTDFCQEIEFITAHRHESVAEHNASVLRNLGSWAHDPVSRADGMLALDDGTMMKYHAPWAGYFDHLDNVVCEKFTVGKAKRK
jgi:hypothetical protein